MTSVGPALLHFGKADHGRVIRVDGAVDEQVGVGPAVCECPGWVEEGRGCCRRSHDGLHLEVFGGVEFCLFAVELQNAAMRQVVGGGHAVDEGLAQQRRTPLLGEQTLEVFVPVLLMEHAS